MRSTNRGYLYPVDQLRAAAATLILLYHSTLFISAQRQFGRPFNAATDWPYPRNPLSTIITQGHTGVALFMVLSGFIFTVGTLGRDVEWLPFLRNRALRIGPLYLVMLFIGASQLGAAFDLGQFVQALLPLTSFGPLDYGGIWGAVFWSIAVEVQFYLIFPFLLRLLNRQGPSALVKLIAVMLMLRAMAYLVTPGLDVNALTYFSLAGRLDQFLLGMLAAVIFVRHRSWCRWPMLVVATIASVTMLWVFSQLHGYMEPRWWRVAWVDVEGLVWAAFIASYVAIFERRTGLIARLIAAIGARSYSTYLLHSVVITWLADRTHIEVPIGSPIFRACLTGALVVFPLTLAAGFLSFAAIERPFLSLRGRYVAPATDTGFGPTPAAQTGRTSTDSSNQTSPDAGDAPGSGRWGPD